MNREELIQRYVESIRDAPVVISDPEQKAERELNRLLFRPTGTIGHLLANRHAKRFGIADPDAPLSTKLRAIEATRDEVHADG